MTRNEAWYRARLAELDTELTAARSELLTLADGDLDADQAERFAALETEYTDKDAERKDVAEQIARFDRVRSIATSAPKDVESGDANRSATVIRTERLDPFDNMDGIRSGMVGRDDLRARALNAIEQEPSRAFTDSQRERATELVERNDRHGRIAQHILMTGSGAYTRAFTRLLEGAQPYQLDGDEMEALRYASEYNRAGMLEGTDAAGGYLVPFHLDPTVMLQNAGSTNPMRQIARVESIAGPKWRGITTAGVSAAWLAEQAEVNQSDPTFAQPEVDVHRASAWLQASFEVTQDTSIVSELGMLLADAKDQLEATAHILGTGSGQPKGIVTAVAADSGSVVAPSTAETYSAADVYKVKDALPPRYRGDTSWLANETVYSLTRQFSDSGGHTFWADFGMDRPSTLLGRPVYESSVMDGSYDATATAAHNYLLLVGQFKNYLIVDRIGMTVQYEPLVKGANRRPTGEVGWFAYWRTGADCLNTDAFRLLDIPTTA